MKSVCVFPENSQQPNVWLQCCKYCTALTRWKNT